MSQVKMILTGVVAIGMAWLVAGSAASDAPRNWYKGNLHTHTVNSDGDSTPNEVASWYKTHGYQFLVISDHNYMTEVVGLNAVHGAREKFLLIPGEEVTDACLRKAIHVNAVNPVGLITPPQGSTVAQTIQNNVDAIVARRGLASLNHPNYTWAVRAEDMAALQGLTLFEVYNGNPEANNRGGGGFQSLDELWDSALTAGKRLFAVAVDDAHHFKKFPAPSNPGRGWIVVRAPALTAEDIVKTLAAGEFYASTGVELADVRVTESEYVVRVKPRGDARQTTYFLGAGGQLLAKSFTPLAVYRFRGDEQYVRARVESSTGETAWTQPAWPTRK